MRSIPNQDLDVETRSDGGKAMFEDLLAKNFSKLMNNTNSWIREVRQIPTT